jgi:DNA-binding CsgD family transcriptional regulator/tetratricopeptide (TPR) repeat protein
MELLERDDDLRRLAVALEEAMAGHARIALVSGEAGIGKTCFVDRFLATRAPGLRLRRGQSDSLVTPMPLGPLYDIARQVEGGLLAQLEGGAPRATIFATLRDQLCNSASLLVIEDIHWADEATLDFIRFLSRRITGVKLLLILTYRDDELGIRHPLRLLLGNLATSRAILRIELARLSIEAVCRLAAGRPFDSAALYRQTSGNPFFLAEVLSHAGCGLPRTVRDSVLARMAHLGLAGRQVLEAAAMIGSRMEENLLERMLDRDSTGLDECVRMGLLELSEQGIAFRHELVRDAVLAELDPRQRRDLSRRALAALRGEGRERGDPAQLAHFAAGAGDGPSVIEFGLAAARTARAAGAHRAAAAQYRLVLGFAKEQTPDERALLLEAYAEECSIVDELAEASRARQEAIELWRRTGERRKEGEILAALAWPLVRSGQNAAAEAASRRAIEVLESLPPTRELAAAYRIQAHLRMLDRDRVGAVAWGRKAIRLARRFGDGATLSAAQIVVGAAMLVAGDGDKGLPHLDRGLALARELHRDDLVGLAHLNLGSAYGELYRFSLAERHLTEGIAYSGDCDLDHARHYMCAWLALTRLYQGRWTEAAELATALIERPHVAAVSRIMALIALGRVRARRGDPGAADALDEALRLSLETGTLQRVAPARAARAEAASLAGEAARAMAEARAGYDLAHSHRHGWHLGEFCFLRWHGGDPVLAPRWAAPPFLLQVRGEWRRAAEAWERLSCPYEQARALADGDAPAQLAALSIFDRLGALPAAAALRQKMRGAGQRRIPRGPRTATRCNPFGLTRREMEILGCLTEGLSNGRIGARLHVSPKTVDHHVSSVLAKLGTASRGEAARLARERRLLAQNGEAPRAK